MRFLLSRRWLLFGVAVALLAYGCWWLGEWQFDRLEERRADNARVERNLERPVAAVTDVLAVGRPADPADEWRRVRATGRYLPEDSVVVRYQTRDGASGVDVVTPLRLAGSGHVVLVDRGWLATDNAGLSDVAVPEPPDGEVTVVGWVRVDGEGDSTAVADGSTRAVSSAAIGPAVGPAVDRDLLGGFVDLARERPPPREPLAVTDLPERGSGPHFFYGLQWWFFAALAVFGFGYLAYDERRHGPRGTRLRRASGAGDPDGPGRGRGQADRENCVA